MTKNGNVKESMNDLCDDDYNEVLSRYGEIDIEKTLSMSDEEIKKEFLQHYSEEEYQEVLDVFEEGRELCALNPFEGISFLLQKGKKFLEQTFDGIGYVYNACHVNTLGEPVDTGDNLGTLIESGVQVAVTDLRIGQTGDEIKINVRWLSEEAAPKEAPQLVCSFMGRESEAAWADWLVNGQTQQVVLKSGQTLAVEDDENLIVRSSWSADENLLLVDVVNRD